MSKSIFIGRKQQLQQLQSVYTCNTANIVVIKGRRRVGKSRLVAEFAKDKQLFSFTGLAPVAGITAQTQRDNFRLQLSRMLNITLPVFTDWSDAFINLANNIPAGSVVLFDEISWMATGDITFIPKLKACWDLHIANCKHTMLVFCGSVSTWIEQNILKSTAFFGRISLIVTVEPFSITESAQFLRALGFRGAAFEIYKLLAVVGGIPWYLEEHLLLQNRAMLLDVIGINNADCVFDGPYRQNKTTRIKGCQIDYLVQTRTKNLFFCEFKFRRRELGVDIINEMQEKIASFAVPRGFAVVPVLFHIGGVAPSIVERQAFYRIIDITNFL